MTMTYGKTTPTYYSDPEVEEMLVHGARIGKVVQIGSHVVDRYPFLQYIPFVTSTLRQWHKEELALFSGLVDGVRTQLVSQFDFLFFCNSQDLDMIVARRPRAAKLWDVPARASRTIWFVGRRDSLPRRLDVWCRK